MIEFVQPNTADPLAARLCLNDEIIFVLARIVLLLPLQLFTNRLSANVQIGLTLAQVHYEIRISILNRTQAKSMALDYMAMAHDWLPAKLASQKLDNRPRGLHLNHLALAKLSVKSVL